MIRKLFFYLLLAGFTAAQAKVLVQSKTEFINGNKHIDLYGKNFVVVSLREPGADGKYYYVDRDGTVVYAGIISSGARGYRTPEGIFNIYRKHKKYMSTKFPDPSGRNNMNYSMFFHRGFALHQGNPHYMSHGCIHLSSWDARTVFKHAPIGTPVVVTRDEYLPHLEPKEYQWLFKSKVRKKSNQRSPRPTYSRIQVNLPVIRF